MAFRRVGILSIGEMGYHWARCLADHGVEVLTCSEGRSEVTRRRAENAGVRSLASLTDFASEAELIVSVVVPSAAKGVASRVAKALLKIGKKGQLYLDANAISPMVAEAAGWELAKAGARFVDGCIIGSAARLTRGTVVYLSGPEAEQLLALQESGFSVRLLGPKTAQASAFKVVYAGLTKGLQALFTELLVGAMGMGLLEEILERYEESFPGLLDKVGPSLAGLTLHAGRRAEEMAELRATFRHYGLGAVMAPATGKLLEQIAELSVAEPSEVGRREGGLRDAVELFFRSGLLQKKGG